jgi:hypothetical protein
MIQNFHDMPGLSTAMPQEGEVSLSPLRSRAEELRWTLIEALIGHESIELIPGEKIDALNTTTFQLLFYINAINHTMNRAPYEGITFQTIKLPLGIIPFNTYDLKEDIPHYISPKVTVLEPLVREVNGLGSVDSSHGGL